jgi:hypothetical protein
VFEALEQVLAAGNTHERNSIIVTPEAPSSSFP